MAANHRTLLLGIFIFLFLVILSPAFAEKIDKSAKGTGTSLYLMPNFGKEYSGVSEITVSIRRAGSSLCKPWAKYNLFAIDSDGNYYFLGKTDKLAPQNWVTYSFKVPNLNVEKVRAEISELSSEKGQQDCPYLDDFRAVLTYSKISREQAVESVKTISESKVTLKFDKVFENVKKIEIAGKRAGTSDCKEWATYEFFVYDDEDNVILKEKSGKIGPQSWGVYNYLLPGSKVKKVIAKTLEESRGSGNSCPYLSELASTVFYEVEKPVVSTVYDAPRLCVDANYTTCYFFSESNSDLRAYSLNDKVSSVKVPEGWKVTLFANSGYTGTKTILSADTADLALYKKGVMENKASSVKITKKTKRASKGSISGYLLSLFGFFGQSDD